MEVNSRREKELPDDVAIQREADSLLDQIRAAVADTPPQRRTELVTMLIDEGAKYFDDIVQVHGEAVARSTYTAHLLIGSTPPGHCRYADLDGGLTLLRRLLEKTRAAASSRVP